MDGFDPEALAKEIFRPPELDLSPEERIVDRSNKYRALIARAREEEFSPETVDEVRARYIAKKGVDFWKKLVRREREKLAVERYVWDKDWKK